MELQDQFIGEKYIQTVLLDNMKGLIEKGFDYVAFVIITQGIEAIGGFYDNRPFEEQGHSGKRFTKGLSLMGTKYDSIKDSLYKNLRCGMAHQLLPMNDISLTSYQSGANDFIHLKPGDKTKVTYLVVDTFYKDFLSACEIVISNLRDESFTDIPKDKKEKIRLNVHKTRILIDEQKGTITEIIE